jgi:GNAT superfamily N-acetyltransferase
MGFRPVRESDIPRLFEVRAATRENALSPDTMERMGITPENVRAMLSSTHMGWVWEEDGLPGGFAMADGSTGELWVIAILPELEGRGIGRGLMERAESWLRSLGWDRAWLTTDMDTSLRAYGFYRALGWSGWKTEGGDRYMEKGLRADG